MPGPAGQAAREQAAAEGDELAPVVRDTLSACVRGEVPVGELVRVAVRLAQLEVACGRSWSGEVLPFPLPVGHDAWYWDVSRLLAAAKTGDLGACQRVLAVFAVFGGIWCDREGDEVKVREP